MKTIKRNLAIGLFALAGIAVNAAPMTDAFAAVQSDSHSELQASASSFCLSLQCLYGHGKKN
ncbi:MAG: hypothetical protein AAF449_09490 [Myxococcota bacterium]